MTQGALNPNCVCDGELTINGVSLSTTAWMVLDLLDLLFTPDYRGKDVVIPEADGQLPQVRRVDETKYSLPMAITGVVDQDGNVYSNPYIGLQTNIDYLTNSIITTATTYVATLTLPDSSVRTADVFVTSLRRGERAGPLVRAILELTVPAGKFV